MTTMHFPQNDDESERVINYSVPPTSREDGEETPIIEQGKKVAVDVARFGFRLTKVGGHYGWKVIKVVGKHGWATTKWGSKKGVELAKKSGNLSSKGIKEGARLSKKHLVLQVKKGALALTDVTKNQALPFIKIYFKELLLSAAVAGSCYTATEYYMTQKNPVRADGAATVHQKK